VISETSREGIRNQIRIGVSKGETQTQIAERIGKHYRSIDAGRASRIARTEVHAAANYGSLSAAEGSSEPLRKRWLATPDNRTRDTHEDAHYQGRGLSQPFEVGNAWLMYPGDTSMGAGPEEVINCRCSLGYERIAPRRKPRRAA
jgi:hypothetical protein